MEIEEYKFNRTLSIQVRFNDIDALGHINNNIYMSYFDLGKTDYFEFLKSEYVSWTEGLIVIARLEVDYITPVSYKEHIVVDTKITHLGNKSGVFIQQVRDADSNEVKCRCKSVFVAYDGHTKTSIQLPEEWKKIINDFEGM